MKHRITCKFVKMHKRFQRREILLFFLSLRCPEKLLEEDGHINFVKF